jgi:cytochrome c553
MTLFSRRIAIISSAFLLGTMSHANAGDIDAGKSSAVACAACHGGNGISLIPSYPNLAGQKEQYLDASLKAYRDGGRKHPIMTQMAANLSDDDIANLSAYFASLNASGK